MTKCLLHMSRIFMIMFSLVFFTNSKRQTSSPTWQPKRVVFQALRYVTRHGEHLIRTAFETCYGLLGGDNHQSCLFGRVFWERVSRMTSFDGKVDKNPCVCCWSIFADVIFLLWFFTYWNFRVAIACVVASLKIQCHNLALVSHSFCDRSLTSRL